MIDVIIPCFNAEKTLMRAVESVLAQSELGTLWLIDDASTDHTLVVAEQLAQAFPKQIKVESLPKNGGVAKARNWGALQSQAEFVAFLDADDAYEPNALQVAQAIFQITAEMACTQNACLMLSYLTSYLKALPQNILLKLKLLLRVSANNSIT